jgi:hypothetical protein
MNEIDPTVSTAINEACTARGQSEKVAARIRAWIEAAAGEGLSAEEQAQRIGLIRDEIEPENAP